jgi:hypothetical protein
MKNFQVSLSTFIIIFLFSLTQSENIDRVIDIFSNENIEYFKLLNNSIIDQIEKHPYKFKYSLIDCLNSNLKINEGKTVEGKDMIYYRISSDCLVEEIQSELPSSLNPQLFSYYIDKILIDNVTSTLNYNYIRNDYALIDFNSSVSIKDLNKEDVLNNATSFLCKEFSDCGKIEIVVQEGVHCRYKSRPNNKLNQNDTTNNNILTCYFNSTDKNKVYELTQVLKVDNSTGVINNQVFYIRGNESYERFDKNGEIYNSNIQINSIAKSFRKFINDTYYPVTPSPVDPSPIPVDPSPSPVNPSPSPVGPSPSPVDPKPDKNTGLSNFVIFLIVIISLSIVVGSGYLICRYKFKRVVNTSPLLL